MSKTKGRTAARTGPGRKTQPSSSGCAEGARAGDPSLAKKMDGRAKAAQDVGVNGTDRLSTAHDDLLRFAYGRRFATILADPPWRFANRTGKMAPEHKRLSRYGTMTFDEIMALPIERLVPPTAHLYLWCPNALLPEGLAVMKAWGFSYKSNIVWHKVRKDGGSDGRGVGFYFRNVTELILFGVRGKNARTLAPGRRQVNLLATRKREHSRKPDQQLRRARLDLTSNYSPAVCAKVGPPGAIRLMRPMHPHGKLTPTIRCSQRSNKRMKPRPPFMENPDKYDIATEVLSSAIRVLQVAGFYESEILQLFGQVASKRERVPLWLQPLPDDAAAGRPSSQARE